MSHTTRGAAESAGAVVLTARCLPWSSPMSLQPFTDLLRAAYETDGAWMDAAIARCPAYVLRELAPPGTVAGNPDWSPGGRWIVFNDHDQGGTPDQAEDIWVIRRSGGPALRLTHNDPAADSSFQPTWSLDGGQIAFVHNCAGDPSTHLFTMTARGTDERDLGVDAPLPFSPPAHDARRLLLRAACLPGDPATPGVPHR